MAISYDDAVATLVSMFETVDLDLITDLLRQNSIVFRCD